MGVVFRMDFDPVIMRERLASGLVYPVCVVQCSLKKSRVFKKGWNLPSSPSLSVEKGGKSSPMDGSSGGNEGMREGKDR